MSFHDADRFVDLSEYRTSHIIRSPLALPPKKKQSKHQIPEPHTTQAHPIMFTILQRAPTALHSFADDPHPLTIHQVHVPVHGASTYGTYGADGMDVDLDHDHGEGSSSLAGLITSPGEVITSSREYMRWVVRVWVWVVLARMGSGGARVLSCRGRATGRDDTTSVCS
jgi:hypothetical protein